MAKVLYSAAMSLDGFIAGAGGDMSWLTEYLGDLVRVGVVEPLEKRVRTVAPAASDERVIEEERGIAVELQIAQLDTDVVKMHA